MSSLIIFKSILFNFWSFLNVILMLGDLRISLISNKGKFLPLFSSMYEFKIYSRIICLKVILLTHAEWLNFILTLITL